MWWDWAAILYPKNNELNNDLNRSTFAFYLGKLDWPQAEQAYEGPTSIQCRVPQWSYDPSGVLPFKNDCDRREQGWTSRVNSPQTRRVPRIHWAPLTLFLWRDVSAFRMVPPHEVQSHFEVVLCAGWLAVCWPRWSWRKTDEWFGRLRLSRQLGTVRPQGSTFLL